MPRIYKTIPVDVRLWRKVRGSEDPNGCWLWTGSINTTTGLGEIDTSIDGKRKKHSVRRIAWELTNGPIPANHSIFAECREKLCCNPKHLSVKDSSYRLVHNPEDLFWKKVCKTPTTTGCWLWTGGTSEHGYGRFNLRVGTAKKRPIGAHRYSYTLAYGPIPDGLCVLHRCDNPPCVNPEHLFLGTPLDNSQDMVKKGRHFTQVHPETMSIGEDRPAAKLTEENVIEMRRLRNEQLVPYHELAEKLGVSHYAAFCACRGITWKFLPGAEQISDPTRKRVRTRCECLKCVTCYSREYWRYANGKPTTPGWTLRRQAK